MGFDIGVIALIKGAVVWWNSEMRLVGSFVRVGLELSLGKISQVNPAAVRRNDRARALVRFVNDLFGADVGNGRSNHTGCSLI